jgi:outer membrane biosynthesis protein TonB
VNDSTITAEAQPSRRLWLLLLAGAALIFLALLLFVARATPAHADTLVTSTNDATAPSGTITDVPAPTPPDATPSDPSATTDPTASTPTVTPDPPAPTPDPATVTPPPADPAPPAPADQTPPPVKHPPDANDPSNSADPGPPVATPPAEDAVTSGAPTPAAAFTEATTVAIPARPFERWARDGRNAPSYALQSSPQPAAPADDTPGAPIPASPMPSHAPETPLAFEAASTSSSPSHGSNNVLMLAAVLVMLGVLCGPQVRRVFRFVSVAPRLDFAFAFERPG